jgi:predicted DNA-binding antitoxin AbrB/MazE fold protein
MSEIVTAVYEKGKLLPLKPLKLRERQAVRIQVLQDEVVSGKPEDEVDGAIQNLIAAGLMRAHPEQDVIPPHPLSAEGHKQAYIAEIGSDWIGTLLEDQDLKVFGSPKTDIEAACARLLDASVRASSNFGLGPAVFG